MCNLKRRVKSGVLVLLCLLTGLSSPAWPPLTHSTVMAETSAVPDLIIESVTLTPETPSVGDTITFTVTIKNLWNALAGASQLACFINEQPITTSLVASIQPGTAVTKTVTRKGQAGPQVFRAVIDSDNRVVESDETNNVGGPVHPGIYHVYLPLVVK